MISSGFWSSCAAFGSSACLIAQDRTVSHADLARIADDWALRARTLLPPGLDRPLVALEMTASVGTVAAYLGCLRASWPKRFGKNVNRRGIPARPSLCSSCSGRISHVSTFA
ncbi:hypothetical protein, partial [Paracoccus haematequi]|uniref:hypothetical protein n=1 Tax=Paracoccus haematequi TaxID=2491866 RepID=UPI0019D25929